MIEYNTWFWLIMVLVHEETGYHHDHSSFVIKKNKLEDESH